MMKRCFVLLLAVFTFGRLLAGEPATAVATITAGFVSGITVTSGGSGYTSEPTITITGGGGSGAAAKAILSGDKVAVVVVLTSGSGYTGSPTVVVEAKAAEEKALAEMKAKAEATKARIVSGGAFQAGEQLVLGLALRWIPAGRFTVGSPGSEERRSSDETQHEVVLSQGFFMAETECTQWQWEKVMGGNPSHFKGSERPVEKVSWDDAVEYCRKLTVKQRGEGMLAEGWKWRLPTEAEWEYAVRAGTTGARHGELEAIAWHSGNSDSVTHVVGGKQANAWGLHDMIGNVWEWCSDWHGDYPTGRVTDPTGPSSGSSRVNRGGSCFNDARNARSADRGRNDPGFRFYSLGFRPALSSVR
jgi:formylglycine-generating enzyme required for sulfatase activity